MWIDGRLELKGYIIYPLPWRKEEDRAFIFVYWYFLPLDVFSGILSSSTLSPPLWLYISIRVCTVYNVWRGRGPSDSRFHFFTVLNLFTKQNNLPESSFPGDFKTKRFCIAFYESYPSSRPLVLSRRDFALPSMSVILLRPIASLKVLLDKGPTYFTNIYSRGLLKNREYSGNCSAD